MGRSLVQDFITDDFKTPVQTVLDKALAGDETDNFEFPLITKSKARIEVLLNATTRRDEQGNVIGVVGIGQDITDRLAQEREYSKLIDTANAPIFGVDTQGAVNVWNKNAQKLVGYSPDEVMGKILVKEFITDEFKTAVQAVLDQALHGEETANFEFPLMTKGGVRLDVLLNATTRRDAQGNIIGVVGIGQDITGRLAQEREYSRLIDTANAPIFGVDTLGRVNVWNKCAMRLIGYSTEEVMGHSLVQEFITNDYQASVQAVLDEALTGAESENFEFPLITKAGTHIEVLLNATTRRDAEGNIIGVVGIGQDITARLAQEREYSKLIDTANAPIFGVDTRGAVNVWNQCAMRLVGYSSEEVMGKILVKEFITDEFKTAVQAVLDQALHGEETANFEFPLMTKGGVRLDVLLNATTRRDEQGNISGVVGIGQDITGRLAQEREYSRLIDTANAPIFGVDTLGRVNVWNKSASRLIGYSTEEVMERSLVQDFITDDFKTPVQTVLDKALAGDETDNFEFPLITKSGARIELLLNATTRRDEQGNVIGVVGIGQDITARLAQEAEYSKLIDTANAPIFGVDTLGAVNVWNQCAMKLVGYSVDEVMGHSLVREFITEDYQASVQSVLDRAVAGVETANFEFPLITKAGSRIEVLLNATTRRNEHGNVIGVVGIGQDITARLTQEREYSKLIDNANAPIFGVDTHGLVNVWNKCARKLVGYSLEEVTGENLVEEFITKEYKDAVRTVLDKALRGEETANFEFPLITKHGVRIEVLLNATTRRDEQGNVIGVVGIGQDITGRIAQEREYSKLIDSANAPIFGVDTQGCVNVWNICARNLVGYSTEEVMGHSLVQEFITDDYQASVQTVLDSALDGVETANFEFPLITKAGARIEVLLNATTRRNEHGKVIGVVGIGQDITGKISYPILWATIRFTKYTQSRPDNMILQGRIAQEREYAKLIDTANAPIFGVDAAGVSLTNASLIFILKSPINHYHN
jgi:PAS domain S-box-containing protein